MKELLNSKLKIYTNDGRIFFGVFKCVDYDSNIILSDTYETRGLDFEISEKKPRRWKRGLVCLCRKEIKQILKI